jgi:hypothetical protein
VDYLSTASAFLGNIDASRIELRGERLDRYQSDFALPEQFKERRLVRG